MSLKKPTHKKSRIVPLVSSLVVVLLLVAAGLFINHARHHDDAHQAEVTANNAKKEAVIDNGGVPSTSDSKGFSPSTDYTAPSNNTGIAITPRTSGSNVIISTKLAGYSDGTCNLTATNGTQTTTQTANVVYAPDYSSCAGFSVPKSTLGTGTWNITLSIVSGGNTTSKSSTYEVTP